MSVRYEPNESFNSAITGVYWDTGLLTSASWNADSTEYRPRYRRYDTDLVDQEDVRVIPSTVTLNCMGLPVIQRGNQIYMWTYSHDDWCNGSGCDSDDRGLNIGDPHSVPWGPDPDGNFYGCPPEDGGPPPNLGPAGDDGTLPEGTCFSDEHNGTLITDENMLSNNF